MCLIYLSLGAPVFMSIGCNLNVYMHMTYK